MARRSRRLFPFRSLHYRACCLPTSTVLESIELKKGACVWRAETLSDFIDFVGKESKPDRTIFRGQSEDWILVPRIARERVAFGTEDERAMLARFKRHAAPYVNPTDWSEWDWINVARHHGLPTRLLDFTINPLAALWFAVSETSTANAVVWAVRYGSNDMVDEACTPFTYGGIPARVQIPKHVTQRITAQGSVFVCLPPSEAPGARPEYLPFDQRRDYGTFEFAKVLIPGEHRARLLDSVEQCGITAAALMPGLEGVAATLAGSVRAELARRPK